MEFTRETAGKTASRSARPSSMSTTNSLRRAQRGHNLASSRCRVMGFASVTIAATRSARNTNRPGSSRAVRSSLSVSPSKKRSISISKRKLGQRWLANSRVALAAVAQIEVSAARCHTIADVVAYCRMINSARGPDECLQAARNSAGRKFAAADHWGDSDPPSLLPIQRV
jgi:hypothetical protein